MIALTGGTAGARIVVIGALATASTIFVPWEEPRWRADRITTNPVPPISDSPFEAPRFA